MYLITNAVNYAPAAVCDGPVVADSRAVTDRNPAEGVTAVLVATMAAQAK